MYKPHVETYFHNLLKKSRVRPKYKEYAEKKESPEKNLRSD